MQLQAISEIWRYPVKSLGGEPMDTATVESDGLRGDHMWAVVDVETGRVASAKRAKLWGALLRCEARLLDDTDLADLGALEIVMPDGATLRGDGRHTASTLSAYIGREVELRSPTSVSRVMEMEWVAESRIGMEAAVEASSLNAVQDRDSDVPVGAVPTGGPNERFYDIAPLHVVTTSSMNALVTGSAEGATRRFRPNIVVGDADWDAGWVEDAWVAQRVRLGAVEAVVRMPTGRCVMINLPHHRLPPDRQTLRALSAVHRRPVGYGTADLPTLGVYADVVMPACIQVGDAVELTAVSAQVGN